MLLIVFKVKDDNSMNVAWEFVKIPLVIAPNPSVFFIVLLLLFFAFSLYFYPKGEEVGL